MEKINLKLVLCGMALLLFSIAVGIVSASVLVYILGGLGLFLVVLGCFENNIK